MAADLSLASLMLGSVRFLALFLVAPFFGHPAIPARLRMSFALAVAGVLGAVGAGSAVPAAATSAGMAGVLLSEALLGFTLGFAIRLVFAGLSLMGEVISVQGGQLPQGWSVGPFSQFRQRAISRARVVLPTPRGPVRSRAWGTRPLRMALRRGVVTWLWPVTSSKAWGLHLRAVT